MAQPNESKLLRALSAGPTCALYTVCPPDRKDWQ